MTSMDAEARRFVGVSAVVFAVSAAITVVWCASMPAMHGMSMAWMRMPGQTWLDVAATFLGMWTVMMVAMMLPALAPMLLRYRRAVAPTTRRDGLTVLVAVAYFAVWTAVGVVAFPAGVGLATLTMRMPEVSHAVPLAAGLVVAMAGLLQWSAWKARRLACCREAPDGPLPADARTAWRHGVRLGVRCVWCCAGPTAILLVVGVMDLRAMAFVTAAISLERLAPNGERVARAVGAVVVVLGASMIARAAG